MIDDAGLHAVMAVFGVPGDGRWGVVVTGSDASTTLVDAGGQVTTAPVEIAGSSGGSWQVAGPGNELSITPTPDLAVAPDQAAGPVELASASGRMALDGAAPELQAGAAVCPAPADESLDSLRLLAAWFPSGHAVALLAARPRRSKGHDRDAISVAAAGEPAGMRVFDPRLSTTYGTDGSPRRAGVELWVGESEEGELYPRRVAGEATGARVARTAGAFSLTAHGMRCHARGEDGVGVYLLLQAR